MISKKELGYINFWANKVPYPGYEYCETTMNDLEKCLSLFIDEYLDRVYNISFSNNEEIEIKLLSKNICHMLGIDYKNLSSEYFVDFRRDILNIKTATFSSYDLLNSIIENKDKILENDDHFKNCKSINYYKVAIKCAIFKKLSDLSNFNYGCINFNKEAYNNECPEIPFSANSTRLLYTPSDEIISPYFIMGLKQETDLEKESPYIIETLFAPENAERFFKKQEVIIPTQIITDNSGILLKKQATASEKLKLIKEYYNIISNNSLENNLNIYGDYMSLLMTEAKSDEKKLTLK